MVAVGSSAGGAQTRILARGNFSLDAGGLVVFLLVLGAVTLGLASLLAAQGYWPVLLVAVIQVVLVTRLLIRVWKNTWVYEEICVGPDCIDIVRQRCRKRSEQCLDSAWATIRVVGPDSPWQAPILAVRSRDQQVELGAFLATDEKLTLAKHMSDAVSAYTAWRKC